MLLHSLHSSSAVVLPMQSVCKTHSSFGKVSYVFVARSSSALWWEGLLTHATYSQEVHGTQARHHITCLVLPCMVPVWYESRQVLHVFNIDCHVAACRYTLNWVKIRVWEQEQWDGIIMIDVDVTVLGDLTHLFHLPTDFAAVPDNGKVWNRYAFAILVHHG